VLTAPGRAEILTRWLLRRPSLLGGQFASRGFLVGASPHFVLGEGKGLNLAAFLMPVEQTPAQQRQFLYLDAISPDQSEIGSNRAFGTYPVVRYVIEREYAESQIVSESVEYKLHLCAPSQASSR
jgi:hypothetical protein